MARKPTGKISEAIIENLDDAVIGIDKEGKIILFNPQAETLFEKKEEEVQGQKIWDILEISDFTRTFISLVKNSDPTRLEQVLPFPGNRIFLAKMHPVRNTDDRVVGAIAILEDLTTIHKMEKTMNEFVAVVSHELKTPLTSIKGFVETLLEGALSNPEVTRKFLQVINNETNRMTRLVISLLDLTRIMRENGHQKATEPINISEVIRDAANLFVHIAEEKGMKLIITVPDSLPGILADRDKIRQVMINLIDNAIKYSSIGKKDCEIEVKAWNDESYIHIHIRDTGIGIPEDEIDKIFNKFYRVQKGLAVELGGTGLGLSITREILKGYGGTIEVESVQNEYSIFKLKLPHILKL